ncbi:MAG: hypothetical protein ACXIU8_09755 [Alkalilacustris sp.]
MGEPGKILTVSYGAFSCRLEGFEEPVTAVRAIAGIFHDLAANTPGFGFPTTDPAALERMVERWGALGDPLDMDVEGKATAALGQHALEGQRLTHAPRPAEASAETAADRTHPAPPPTAGPPRALTTAPVFSTTAGETKGPDTFGAGPASAARAQGARSAHTGEELPEVAVDRLMRRTNAALAGTDARQRHRLVGHLKAAVAATRAGESEGLPAPGASEEMVARFRADLASAMARRGEAGRTPSGHPPDTGSGPQDPPPPPAGDATDGAQTPSQSGMDADRLPDPDTEDGPSQPRPRPAARVDSDTFEAFATVRGARELPDVLEAAAAYATEVEGLEAFTRQHVMRCATAMGYDVRAEREAGLRAFGRLLREGRLVRAQRGLFTLAPPESQPAALVAGCAPA